MAESVLVNFIHLETHRTITARNDKHTKNVVKKNSHFKAFFKAFYLVGIKKAVTFMRNCLIFRVPRTGIEPALPCDNQILSLAQYVLELLEFQN